MLSNPRRKYAQGSKAKEGRRQGKGEVPDILSNACHLADAYSE